MTNRIAQICVAAFSVLILAAAACGTRQQAAERTAVNVKVNLVPEYEVAGVSQDDAAAFEKARRTFTSEHLPKDHGFHTHTYFSDYQVHLRNADRWVTLIEKGRLTSLDNPEVRARASRYGNPDQLLAEDWRPEIPGINAPGDYLADYAPDPWRTVKGVIDRVLAGNYDHFFPLTSGPHPSGTRATEH